MDLANALADLGEMDRVIVGLRYAAGLTSAEIGSIVGMSAGGVRARLARLLDRLRKELDDDAPAN
jgi:RNA polymerase sigma factor (sigma-70 family)